MHKQTNDNFYDKKLINILKKNQNKRILFWGASLFLEEFLTSNDLSKYNIIGIVDKNLEKNGQTCQGYNIFSPEKIKSLNIDIIILTIKNNIDICYKDIKKYLTSESITIPVKKILNSQTAERLKPELCQSNIFDYILFLKHKFAYTVADKFINKNSTVLEIGCGEGYGTNFLARSGAQITALDIDAKTIKKAKLKYSQKNITFKKFDGYNINYPEQSFDVIISFQVIEHVENVEKYLKNIKKFLKPNGIFIITTPSRTYRLTENQTPINKYHIREYNAKTLSADIAKVFNKFQIFSITAKQEVLDIEFERVRPSRSDYDKIPKKISLPENFKSKYTVEDFYLNNKDLDSGLDLLISNINVDIFDSANYWDKRYLDNKNSGYGSYGKLAEFKAQIINHFVEENKINSCIELGTGDGNQLSLLKINNYTGFDVSTVAIENLKHIFKNDTNKKFFHINALN